MKKERTKLKGSERKLIPNGNRTKERPDLTSSIEVTISVRRKNTIPEWVTHSGLLSREQLASDHGATASDFMAISRFAEEYDLKVVEENPLTLTIKLEGTIQNMEKAFGITLHIVKIGDVSYRERIGPITIPNDLEGIIEGVFGLDNRPQAHPRFRIAPRTASVYSPIEIARLYNFPPGDGDGSTIAIIELEGGFERDDLDTYFTNLGLKSPAITAPVFRGGASNSPIGDPNGADGEVMLDIEVAGAIAPKANIKVYFAPNTSKGFLDAINAAIFDSETTVISISWGNPEELYTSQSLNAFEKAFQNAAAMSILITVASGDSGSTDGTKALTVDFPASAPHVLACGGTHLEGGALITEEVVWNSEGGSSGGGVSKVFKKPTYQNSANVPAPTNANGGRGVPDVCGNAALETGYNVRVDGIDTVIGGTSAVAPLWAGLIARLAQNLGHKVPFLNPILYNNENCLRNITEGNNDVGNGGGKYQACEGWNACTGLGSPDGMLILNTLKGISLTTTDEPTNASDQSAGIIDNNNQNEYAPITSLPQPVESNPILSNYTYANPLTIPTGNVDSESIAALVALASNVATSAITAITAISSNNKK